MITLVVLMREWEEEEEEEEDGEWSSFTPSRRQSLPLRSHVFLRYRRFHQDWNTYELHFPVRAHRFRCSHLFVQLHRDRNTLTRSLCVQTIQNTEAH